MGKQLTSEQRENRRQRDRDYRILNRERDMAYRVANREKKQQYDAKRRAIKRDQMPMANPDFRIVFTEEMTKVMTDEVNKGRNREYLADFLGVSYQRLFRELKTVGLSKPRKRTYPRPKKVKHKHSEATIQL